MDEAIIDLNNLCFRWKKSGNILLDIPKFQLKQNEHVFLQGPSGCGKSTLLSLVGGILISESGSLKVLGQEIWDLSRSGRDAFRVDHMLHISTIQSSSISFDRGKCNVASKFLKYS